MTSTSTSSKAAPTYRLPQRQPPLASKCLLHGQQPDQLCIVVTQAALHQIMTHSLSDTERELGGALLGQAYRHGERLYVEIKAALPAVSRDHGPVHFTFSADSWTALQRAQAEQYPQLDIVGWFHTHPDLGVFYSSDDVVVHSAAFTLPWHVGLVLDPVRHEGCFFGWHEGELSALPGFYELLDEVAESVIGWRVAISHFANEKTGVYQEPPPNTSRAHTQPGRSRPPTLLEEYGRWLVLSGITLLLLALLLLAGWAGRLQRQVNQMQQVMITLADETWQTANISACPDPQLRLLLPLAGSSLTPGPISFVGTAVQPQAHQYRLEGRLSGNDEWQLLNQWRREVTLDELASWDTSDYAPGQYEVRLIAVDSNNVRLTNSALCQIMFELGS
jgi:proteasome lid subunit RPN8/RPN11